MKLLPALPGLSPVGGKPVVARFDGGHPCSDGGLLVLGEVERRLDVAGRLAACIADPRDPERIVHGLDEIIRFRLLMVASGYEDGNDAGCLRTDPMFRLAMEWLDDGAVLCSQPTISLLDAHPASHLVRHRLDAMAADAKAYFNNGYEPELDALGGLITTAQASRSTC